MKNKLVMFCFAILLIFVFACTIPENFIIKGNPSLEFATNMDLGELLDISGDELFGSGNGNTTMLECTNQALDIKTYIIHKIIHDDKLMIENRPHNESETDVNITINGQSVRVNNSNSAHITLLDDYIVSNYGDGDVVLSFENFGNLDELEGFIFNSLNVNTMLYISGSEIVEKQIIDITADTVDLPTIEEHLPSPGGFNLITKKYNGVGLPAGGEPIEDIDIVEYMNDKERLPVDYKIVMPLGTQISRQWLAARESSGHDIFIELAIWIPMELIAAGDIVVQGIQGQGAELIFPSDFFDGVNEFLESVMDVSDKLSMEIGLSKNHPFNDAYLVINNFNMAPITNKLSGNKMGFNFTPTQIEQINDLGFNPGFRIFFTNGSAFNIPREFDINVITVSLKADLYIEL